MSAMATKTITARREISAADWSAPNLAGERPATAADAPLPLPLCWALWILASLALWAALLSLFILV